jgi:hypothetical protein
MGIEEVSMRMSQDKVREEAALKVGAMTLQGAENQAAAMMKLLDSVKNITDPRTGSQVDLLV